MDTPKTKLLAMIRKSFNFFQHVNIKLQLSRSKTYKKLSVFLVVSNAITPIALNAEQSFFKDKLPSIVKNIAQGFEDGNTEAATKNEVIDYSLNAVNSAPDSIEDSVVATTPFADLELSLGSDAFGLDKNGTATKTEVLKSDNLRIGHLSVDHCPT